MALLVGRHVNKIDAKGRVSVPKPFRAAFAEQEFAGLYAYPLFRHPAIEACDERFMKRLSESIDALDMFSEDQDDLATIVMNNAEALPFDPEGRVMMPRAFLEHTGIKDKAVFVGRGSRFQIWAPEAFEIQNEKAYERARARGATLKLSDNTGGEA
ncbi:MAG: division/cell wall cluster transcriptional repressor MraZ [Rhodospirillales bacterium]